MIKNMFGAYLHQQAKGVKFFWDVHTATTLNDVPTTIFTKAFDYLLPKNSLVGLMVHLA